ncbi:RIP metalloprotease RseP [Legionella taurinensis]|uniref:Zinc metalloprotease n=1 Tax=Legionella taurinensis TaxID=70611 RepID=A0A3A5LIP0_9GAMM|nr:RIP metalloprotease RseP [Legionella taurinensis]MDX1837718.1 RIP metalloprotease RseP [Legionella taurinensis]PUT40000.1 RIP metalloprotease RseP [Legionella taurinensis]PUT43766.1 RIP metalloprotease RseP [Legionella taurinensis]PUT46101.1 RIP metalloprotease RseP [Legionella taurinensis]PUT47921.1 RIP metalloprotease RseP [Legionella taurinensis]
MAYTLVFFILALLLLVTVHEFGHFIVARLCGVKVLRFSFGFGKVLFRWHDRRGTEYAWSLLPLGGYVKMLDEGEGEVPAEERHLAFNNKSVWARIAIVAAGPLFNLIFAFLALWLVLVIGIYSLAPMIEAVKPGSLAHKAGLNAQQEIIELNGESVRSWRDFQYLLLPLVGSDETVSMTVKPMAGGEQKTVMLPLSEWQLDPQKPDPLASLGITPFIPTIPPIVGEVMEDSPAAKAGLTLNDTIQTVDGKPLSDWLDLVEIVRNNPDRVLMLGILRDGKSETLALRTGSKDVNGSQEGYIGVRSKKVDWPKEWLRVQREGPIAALGTALRQTVDLTATTFSLIGRFATGKLALKTISGPVGIAQGAGESARSGIAYYLSFLALVSISLGVLNLLPIPMLDGGHLLYYFIEIIIRRPLSEGIRAAGLYVGLAFLIALTVLALTNDISRLTS